MSEEKKISFVAAFRPNGQVVRFDNEGEGTITIKTPATEIANAVRLLAFTGKSFKVTVEDLD